MEFLKENAEHFERRAIEALKERPRFVLFFAEQAIQLYIKYILAKELDDYPAGGGLYNHQIPRKGVQHEKRRKRLKSPRRI